MSEKKSNGQAKPKAPRKPRDPNAPKPVVIPARDFVIGWQACASVAEAKAKLGKGAVGRAARMRKQGVNLKALGGGRGKLDVNALNALISAPVAVEAPKPVSVFG